MNLRRYKYGGVGSSDYVIWMYVAGKLTGSGTSVYVQIRYCANLGEEFEIGVMKRFVSQHL